VHTQAHLDSLATSFDQGGAAIQVQGDMFCNAHTLAAARLSCGSAVEATLAVVHGELDAAFAVIRPPGHHAECDRATGFCWINNASCAALAARSEGLQRVAVVDFDVHHGNGIELIHYADPSVLYVSLHRYGGFFYPGSGNSGDVGKGAGRGFNVNIPWRESEGTDEEYAAAFDLLVCPLLRDFRPELILISAGYDAAAGDPLGGMLLTPACYHSMTQKMMGCVPGGKVVALLEGGYSLHATAACSEATLRALLGEDAPLPASRVKPLKRSAIQTFREVAEIQSRFWPDSIRPEAVDEYVLEHAAKLAAQPKTPVRQSPRRPVAAPTPPPAARISK
jgi:histone deacetylase 6